MEFLYKPGDKIHDYANRDNGVILACITTVHIYGTKHEYIVEWDTDGLTDTQTHDAARVERGFDEGHIDWATDIRYEQEPELNPER